MWAAYLLQSVTAAIAFFQLAKDWNAHKHDWRRVAVFVLILVLMGCGIYNTWRGSKSSAEQHDRDVNRASQQHNEDLQQIAALKLSVETSNRNQSENTQVFVHQFSDLSKQLADLQTRARTEELQTKVSQLQRRLDANLKAMEPAPKAELVWTFSRPGISTDSIDRE